MNACMVLELMNPAIAKIDDFESSFDELFMSVTPRRPQILMLDRNTKYQCSCIQDRVQATGMLLCLRMKHLPVSASLL